MLVRNFASVAVLTLVLPASQAMSASHGKDMEGILPNAQPGECYAKVIIPAVYETITEHVLVKPVSEEVSVVDATFESVEKPLIEKEAFTKISVIPTKFREEVEKVEVSKASTQWVTDLGKKGIPASPALLAGAKTNGVDLQGAAVGACYTEYYTPPKYEETSKEVLVKEESEDIKIVEAQFEEVEEMVVVKQASQKKVYRPAEFESIEEKIEVESAKTVWKKSVTAAGEIVSLVNVPAVFETVSKTVLKAESTIDLVEIPEETKAFKVNKLVNDAMIDKVKVPAEYQTVKLTNLVSDASFTWTAGPAYDGVIATGNQICLREIPAKYQEIKKLMVEAPAVLGEEKVSPVTKLIKVNNVAAPAKQVRKLVQAQYKTVEKRRKISDERTTWRQVMCEVDRKPDINKKIQQALKDSKFYDGPVDGAIGRGTISALISYQKKNGLAISSGSITIETLEKLGVM